MFHCQIAGEYIVLQQTEARSLFRDVSGSAVSAMTYNMRDVSGGFTRVRANQRAIIEQLKRQHADDPETFRRKFVFRSDWGPSALPTLLALLDGHRRLSPYIDCEEIDRWARYSADPGLLGSYEQPDSVDLLLVGRTRLFSRRRVISAIELRLRDLEHVFGTTHSFIVMARFSKLSFSPEGLTVERRYRPRKTRRGRGDAF